MRLSTSLSSSSGPGPAFSTSSSNAAPSSSPAGAGGSPGSLGLGLMTTISDRKRGLGQATWANDIGKRLGCNPKEHLRGRQSRGVWVCQVKHRPYFRLAYYSSAYYIHRHE